MKILIVSNLFPPHFIGGYEIAAEDTVNILSENNHDCLVLTSDYVKKDTALVAEKKILRRLKLHENWGDKFESYSVPEISKYNALILSEVITSYKPDIVYFWNIYGLGIQIIRISKQKGIPYTIHFMDLSILFYHLTPRGLMSKIFHPKRREICDLNSLIGNSISVSKYVKNKLKKYCGKDSEIIYPYLSSRDNLVKKDYSIGVKIRSVYIGQIEKHKGIHTVCEAIKKFNSIQDKFQIFLDVYGMSLSNLDEELLDIYGDFLRVHKGVARWEILKKLPNYDLGFFPSIWEEPFGIAQIEMMQAGLPIFTTGVGGAGEPLEDGNHILFKRGDAEDLKQQLAQFLSTYNSKARQIGQNAARHIENKFSKQTYVVALNGHLDKIISAGIKEV